MQNINRINVLPDPASSLEIESDSYADLAFLKQDAAAPFPIRLARELTETISAIRQDPMMLISVIAKRESSSPEKKRRMKAGIMVAIRVYSIALSAIYASYAIFHRRDSSDGDEQHLKIMHLQLPPMPVTKTLPVLKQPGENSKSQLTMPAQPPEQNKTELVKSESQPRALDQTQTNPEPKAQVASVASEPSSIDEAKASAVLAASGAGGGPGTGNGTGPGRAPGRRALRVRG